jgi:hypothetical protein
MKVVPLAESTMAWKPAGVQSSRTVALLSSSPWPRYVRISGNCAASASSMIGDSSTRKRPKPPWGSGKDITSGAPAARISASRGATASRPRSTVVSRRSVR